MILKLTAKLFKSPPPMAGYTLQSFRLWERGFESFGEITRPEAARQGKQFLNGWDCAACVFRLAYRRPASI